MIEGRLIRLRPWQEDDLPVLTLMRNDVELQSQLLARVRGSSVDQVRKWLNDRSSRSDSVIFIIADRETNSALGYVQISGLDTVDQRAELGICLTREAQGCGAGSESLRLACTYMRDMWSLRKISLKVRTDNDAAIRCYRKVGFKSCGLLRQHVFIAGIWQNIMLMDIFLKPDG